MLFVIFFIKCNSILPVRFIELSAGVSKSKQNNEYNKSTFLTIFFPPLLTRITISSV